MREWNGEENREQEKGLIFLTPTACRRHVWDPLRIKATRKWRSLCLDLSFAPNIIPDLQLVAGSAPMLARRDIWLSSPLSLQEAQREAVRLCRKGCFQASICTVDAAGTS